MDNLKLFISKEEVGDCFNGMKLTVIGNGVEGVAYLDNNNHVYKQIKPNYAVLYDPSIITTSKFDLDSFIFPDQLFLCGKDILGYRTRYFKDDVLCDVTRKETVEIDLEKLLEAREKMIEDVKVLTEADYVLDDMYGNVLFNGENLAAIDTLDYPKINNIELYENIELLDYAIITRLVLIDSRVKRLQDSSFDEIVDYLADKDVFELRIPRMK